MHIGKGFFVLRVDDADARVEEWGLFIRSRNFESQLLPLRDTETIAVDFAGTPDDTFNQARNLDRRRLIRARLRLERVHSSRAHGNFGPQSHFRLGARPAS